MTAFVSTAFVRAAFVRTALVGAISCAACGSESSTSGEGDGAGTGAAPGTGPTFYEDVAPILAAECVVCHRPDGIGPMPLITYGDVVPYSDRVKTLTAERVMPPHPADASGSCTTYLDARWLDASEIATLGAWVDGGMREGNAANAPALPGEPDSLATVTHTAPMPAAYTPLLERVDDYRCFVIDPGVVGATKYITEYEVVPGEPRVVHHVVVYHPTTDAGAARAWELERADATPGYECFGSSGVTGAGLVIAWSPGSRVIRYPAGTGVALTPVRPVIVQIHYHPDANAAADQSTVNFRLADAVDREIVPWFFAEPDSLLLPPREAHVEQVVELTPRQYLGYTAPAAAGRPMTVFGIRGHMHLLGTSIRVQRVGATTDCMLDIPRYDWGWQYSYFFEHPIRVEPDDVLRMSCSYDTRSRASAVRWGEGTEDEMCLGTFYASFE